MKKKNTHKPKVSILIINFNNAKFIKECINSILKQKYKNYEIIFFDDNSNDNSVKVVKEFVKKNFFLIQNKEQSIHGSYNQMNGYAKSLQKSTGEIIFFLDSDDFFQQNKIQKIVNEYNCNFKKKIIVDMPIYKWKNRTIKKNFPRIFIKNYWSFFPPQSCISMKREYAKKILKNVNFQKFPNIWLDFRISVYSKYFEKIFFLNENLTYYRQSSSQETSNFKSYGLNWWRRRNEAHDYIKFFFKLKKINHKINLDYLITKIINFFLKTQ